MVVFCYLSKCSFDAATVNSLYTTFLMNVTNCSREEIKKRLKPNGLEPTFASTKALSEKAIREVKARYVNGYDKIMDILDPAIDKLTEMEKHIEIDPAIATTKPAVLDSLFYSLEDPIRESQIAFIILYAIDLREQDEKKYDRATRKRTTVTYTMANRDGRSGQKHCVCTQNYFRHVCRHVRMSGSATPATQNGITACFDNFKKDRFCSFPLKHGVARGKPETRDETCWSIKTSISC